MDNQKVSVFTIILDVIKYYKISIVTIISLFVILLAFSNLGVIPGVFSIITFSLIYWGIIGFDMLKPIAETNLTPLVSYKQAKKTCSNKVGSIESKPKTLLGRLVSMFVGGGNIAKEIKKAGKTISGK